MKSISVTQAFANAPPRRPAVLCLRRPGGGTEMVLTEWFTWLNIKRQPMISFSLRRDGGPGLDLAADDPLVLAFPPVEEALKYEKAVRTAESGAQEELPDGVLPVAVRHVRPLVPAGSEVVLRCTLAGAYNYPFKRVRIFNCNLEEALGRAEGDPD